jgi:hypothetical protein
LGVFLIALFFAIATCILLGVGTALLLPGSKLEVIWKLYPARRAVLMPYRVWLGPGFLILAIVMASASIGCFRRRIWGWWLAVFIFLINGLSDAGQILIGHFLEGWYRRCRRRLYPFLPVATPRARCIYLKRKPSADRACAAS